MFLLQLLIMGLAENKLGNDNESLSLAVGFRRGMLTVPMVFRL